jgi:hypothetical protein
VIGTLGRAANGLNILINWFGDKNDGKRLIPAVLCPVGVKDVTVPADPSGGLHRFDPIVGEASLYVRKIHYGRDTRAERDLADKLHLPQHH